MPELAPSRQRSPIEIDLGAAAGQRAHDRRAAADVGAVADDDAGRDPALDHRRAERAGVVVDEALVHDRGALGQVGAEPDPVGVGDPDAGRDHVVDHPGELVHAVHGDRAVGEQPQPGPLELLRRGRAGGGPRPRWAARRRCRPGRQPVRPDQPVRRAGAAAGTRRGCRPAARPGRRSPPRSPGGGPAAGVGAAQRGELGRRRGAGGAAAEGRCREPDVEDAAGVGDGGQAVAPRAAGHPTTVRRGSAGAGDAPGGALAPAATGGIGDRCVRQ